MIASDHPGIPDASTGRSSRLEYWSSFLRENKFFYCAEVGVWKGDFSARMLADCPEIRQYLMIDSWRHLEGWDKPFNVSDSQFEEIYNEALEKTEFATERRKVLRGMTLEVESLIPAGSLDFAYIDGDHTLRGIVIDSLVMWEKLRVGGVLAGDDHARSIWQHGRGYEPTLVNPFMSYFAEAVGCRLEEVGEDQFFIRKTARTGLISPPSRPLLPLILEQGCCGGPSVKKPAHALAMPVLKAGAKVSRRMRERLRALQGVPPMSESVRRSGVLLIHIPKNAGTSLSQALYGEDIGHLSLKVWVQRYPYTVRRMKVFAVIRDPVDRFVSAFHFLKGGGMNSGDAAFARLHLAEYDSPESLAEAMNDPGVFRSITSYYHFIPQVSFLRDPHGRLGVKLLVPYSKLSDGEYLSSVLGRELSLPRLNVTKRPPGGDLPGARAVQLIRTHYGDDQRLHEMLVAGE